MRGKRTNLITLPLPKEGYEKRELIDELFDRGEITEHMRKAARQIRDDHKATKNRRLAKSPQAERFAHAMSMMVYANYTLVLLDVVIGGMDLAKFGHKVMGFRNNAQAKKWAIKILHDALADLHDVYETRAKGRRRTKRIGGYD
jgi:hypothetical protein